MGTHWYQVSPKGSLPSSFPPGQPPWGHIASLGTSRILNWVPLCRIFGILSSSTPAGQYVLIHTLAMDGVYVSWQKLDYFTLTNRLRKLTCLRITCIKLWAIFKRSHNLPYFFQFQWGNFALICEFFSFLTQSSKHQITCKQKDRFWEE